MSDWKNLDNELSVKLRRHVRIGDHRSLPPFWNKAASATMTARAVEAIDFAGRSDWRDKCVMRALVIDAERIDWRPFTAFFFYLNSNNRKLASRSKDGKAKDGKS